LGTNVQAVRRRRSTFCSKTLVAKGLVSKLTRGYLGFFFLPEICLDIFRYLDIYIYIHISMIIIVIIIIRRIYLYEFWYIHNMWVFHNHTWGSLDMVSKCNIYIYKHGYGSIPTNTIFRGMNIHLHIPVYYAVYIYIYIYIV
jgi:hypothetical protein